MFWKERRDHIHGLLNCRKKKNLNMPHNVKIRMEKRQPMRKKVMWEIQPKLCIR
jgi:hypothetical protein